MKVAIHEAQSDEQVVDRVPITKSSNTGLLPYFSVYTLFKREHLAPTRAYDANVHGVAMEKQVNFRTSLAQ